MTLNGVGGAGKTRLAAELAGRLDDRFPDGVWWCELAPAALPADVAGAVGDAVGVDATSGRGGLDGTVEHLAARRGLLVLDNCEHVLDAAADVAERLVGRLPRRAGAGHQPHAAGRGGRGGPGRRRPGAAGRRRGTGWRGLGRRRALPGPRAGRGRRRGRRLAGPRGRRDLPAPRRPAAGHRARRRAHALAHPGRDRRPPRRALRPARGLRPARRGTPSHAARGGRLVLRAARRAPAPALRAPRGVRAGGHARGGAGRLRGRGRRHAATCPSCSTSSSPTRSSRRPRPPRAPSTGCSRRCASTPPSAWTRAASARPCATATPTTTWRAPSPVIEAALAWRSTLPFVDEFDEVRAALRWCVEADAEPQRAFTILVPLWGLSPARHAEEIAMLADEALDRWPGDHPLRLHALGTAATARLFAGDPAGGAQPGRGRRRARGAHRRAGAAQPAHAGPSGAVLGPAGGGRAARAGRRGPCPCGGPRGARLRVRRLQRPAPARGGRARRGGRAGRAHARRRRAPGRAVHGVLVALRQRRRAARRRHRRGTPVAHPGDRARPRDRPPPHGALQPARPRRRRAPGGRRRRGGRAAARPRWRTTRRGPTRRRSGRR